MQLQNAASHGARRGAEGAGRALPRPRRSARASRARRRRSTPASAAAPPPERELLPQVRSSRCDWSSWSAAGAGRDITRRGRRGAHTRAPASSTFGTRVHAASVLRLEARPISCRETRASAAVSWSAAGSTITSARSIRRRRHSFAGVGARGKPTRRRRFRAPAESYARAGLLVPTTDMR